MNLGNGVAYCLESSALPALYKIFNNILRPILYHRIVSQ